MTPTRSARRRSFLIHLTVRERDLLFAHVDPPDALDRLFHAAHVTGPLVGLELDGEQLDELLQHLEGMACHAQNEEAQAEFARTVERINAGFEGTVDPGWHMVRPAIATRGYSAKQGQYLAFIHAYMRLHRRAPAESDLRVYFRVSPPSVHTMLKTLQRDGLISRRAGEARSIRLLLEPYEIPELE